MGHPHPLDTPRPNTPRPDTTLVTLRRVGSSAPFHAGAGAVDYSLPYAQQQAEYVALLSFLREELCVKHGKRVIFRTWDTQFAPPYRFHGSPEYYLNVTDKIEPHPLLYMSIKHVQLVRRLMPKGRSLSIRAA